MTLVNQNIIEKITISGKSRTQIFYDGKNTMIDIFSEVKDGAPVIKLGYTRAGSDIYIESIPSIP